MAKSNFTVIAGVPFSACEKFGPRTLAAMFGPTLPYPLRADRSGSVSVISTARHLSKLYAKGMVMFADDEIVTPGTPAALTEFN
ncbi:hypothetical protein ACFFKC_22225 [Pseudoduganella danionis]|uniref:Uncharacterized protein n=1 Tax=Pseudoduganella danionis TaxID=1890295 RepID=A0ABW9SWK7_9BURK|nr:hypothetical protein [Pseudoduganella danionis]MTW35518.1 hypothetical protein [Pseudoduganella danionis]